MYLYSYSRSVTPSDTDDLTFKTKGLMVSTSGDVLLQLENDSAPILVTLQAGIVYNFVVKRIWASYSFDGGTTTVNTTATGIVAFY